ncbi:hypothetical protein [Kribbella deserti]|uniref:Collagen-like protein n=1 Tax=Kribbella deserti TaxID=1926257 RepID=A0ABV6QEJ0_9ACTN
MFAQLFNLTGQVSETGDTAARALNVASSAQLQARENEKALARANRDLVAAGKQPVPVPTVTVQPPAAGDRLTVEDLATIRLVAAEEVARAKSPISQAEITQIARVAATLVPKPKDGKSVTAEDVAPLITVAVATYCANDRCTGKRGDDGTDGTKGADGVDGIDGAPGKDAPKVTDEQLRPLIAASLASYCAQESKPCRGQDGRDGTDGKDGKDAPPPVSIADTDCVGDDAASYWRIHYTNGTEGTARGPCRIGPESPAPTNARRTK